MQASLVEEKSATRKYGVPPKYNLPGLRIRIHLIRIRIQHFRLNTDLDPDPIWIRGFDEQKFTADKKFVIFFNYQKLQFTYPSRPP